MDLVGPLTLSTNENKYILTLLDQFSRFCAVVPIHNKSAKTVFTEILKHWFSPYGTLTKISALKVRIKVYPL